MGTEFHQSPMEIIYSSLHRNSFRVDAILMQPSARGGSKGHFLTHKQLCTQVGCHVPK
jgi:hypothetical protein